MTGKRMARAGLTLMIVSLVFPSLLTATEDLTHEPAAPGAEISPPPPLPEDPALLPQALEEAEAQIGRIRVTLEDYTDSKEREIQNDHRQQEEKRQNDSFQHNQAQREPDYDPRQWTAYYTAQKKLQQEQEREVTAFRAKRTALQELTRKWSAHAQAVRDALPPGAAQKIEYRMAKARRLAEMKAAKAQQSLTMQHAREKQRTQVAQAAQEEREWRRTKPQRLREQKARREKREEQEAQAAKAERQLEEMRAREKQRVQYAQGKAQGQTEALKSPTEHLAAAREYSRQEEEAYMIAPFTYMDFYDKFNPQNGQFTGRQKELQWRNNYLRKCVEWTGQLTYVERGWFSVGTPLTEIDIGFKHRPHTVDYDVLVTIPAPVREQLRQWKRGQRYTYTARLREYHGYNVVYADWGCE